VPGAKRIFIIADFKDEWPKSIRMQPRMWIKGLIRLGCDVQSFSYRNIMLRSSPLPGKRLARHFAKKKADSLLAELVRCYHPDIVFVLGMKYVDVETIDAVRDVAPNAIYVSRDDDPFPDRNRARIALARSTDIIMTTSGGRFLRVYKDAGVPCCAFIPNMCDPDVQYKYKVEAQWKTDILFTGKAEHTRLDRNDERHELVQRLGQMPNSKVYGSFGIPRIEGIDYFRAISSSRIGLSISIANDVRFYHSDRFINYLSCGTAVLARRVPDSDLLFEDGVHVRYFDAVDEFFELAEWYLQHDREREQMAQAGMQQAHEAFNTERIVQYMLDLIDTGTYDAPWVELL
jgi:spore maturation protein CgeB